MTRYRAGVEVVMDDDVLAVKVIKAPRSFSAQWEAEKWVQEKETEYAGAFLGGSVVEETVVYTLGRRKRRKK